MNAKRLLFFSLVLSGIIFLSACVPENTPPPAETMAPNPSPYPAPDDDFVRPTDSTEPYPEPEPAVVIDPYPGVENPMPDPDRILTVQDFSPVSLDKKFNRGPAFMDSTDIVMKESFPVQVELVLSGSLPTPCHQLRVVPADPDADGHIAVEVYSVSDPDKMCIQVLEPFEAVVPLGDFTDGDYTISINGEPVGEISFP